MSKILAHFAADFPYMVMQIGFALLRIARVASNDNMLLLTVSYQTETSNIKVYFRKCHFQCFPIFCSVLG